MRFVLLLLLTSVCLFSYAQDYPDYRSKKENFVRVREKDVRSDLGAFTMAGIDESMGKTPLKTIPMKELGVNYMSFEGNNIKITIKAAPFDAAGHKINYYDEKYLVKIDNKPFYGSYGKMPKNVLSSVTVTINNDTVHIPPAAYSDIYDPVFTYNDASGVQRSLNRVYISADNRTVYIYMVNRNNGGTEVTWVIQDKKYLRRVLDFGFMK